MVLLTRVADLLRELIQPRVSAAVWRCVLGTEILAPPVPSVNANFLYFSRGIKGMPLRSHVVGQTNAVLIGLTDQLTGSALIKQGIDSAHKYSSAGRCNCLTVTSPDATIVL